MRIIFGMVLILGIGLAGFAVFMVQGYMGDQQAALQQERERAAEVVETVNVLAAKKQLAFGDALTADDIQFVKYAKDFLPEGTFADVEALFPEGPNVVRSLLRPLEPNEVILLTDLTEPGQIASITQELNPLMRAFTIRVDASTGVSGFLRPNDRVDIYWTGTVGEPGSNEQTNVIGSSIRLIAVDQSIDRNRASTSIPSTVTVEVIPGDVARLAEAQSKGRLSLALVGDGNENMAVAIGEQAIFLPQPPEKPVQVVQAPVVAPTPPRECFTTVRRGTEAVQAQIACTD
ncbi:Flp pilus assembly protein CpaB [Loktanella sp. SALINAS62]|uniref:Flp pilus assembly protein CpaB n=1 Tax=Loktanella sp. SALINAS62 TaxID=2706124 RepID=UPI001B8ACBFF|nr:Flp pilus assembly protein CpaB [Loktanella sp. SALINAS62]MBS1300832.1 Flp pilus assembly protein CpaB [Loktanella sp. SALINAS62]